MITQQASVSCGNQYSPHGFNELVNFNYPWPPYTELREHEFYKTESDIINQMSKVSEMRAGFSCRIQNAGVYTPDGAIFSHRHLKCQISNKFHTERIITLTQYINQSHNTEEILSFLLHKLRTARSRRKDRCIVQRRGGGWEPQTGHFLRTDTPSG